MLESGQILDQLVALDATPFALAVVVGGMIGLERELHGRPAGLRTHILVCLASTLLVQASRWSPGLIEGEAARVVLDPNRLAAGIVTGIGFLGAAAVIRSGDIVRGITTGACVWAVAGLGVVLGQGHYGLAIAGALVMLLVLALFDSVFAWVQPVVYRQLRIRLPASELTPTSERVRALLAEQSIRVQDVTGRSADDGCEIVFHVRCRQRAKTTEIVDRIREELPLESAEWSQIGG